MEAIGIIAIVYLMITAFVCLIWLGLLILSIPFRIIRRTREGKRPPVTAMNYHRGPQTTFFQHKKTRSKRGNPT